MLLCYNISNKSGGSIQFLGRISINLIIIIVRNCKYPNFYFFDSLNLNCEIEFVHHTNQCSSHVSRPWLLSDHSPTMTSFNDVITLNTPSKTTDRKRFQKYCIICIVLYCIVLYCIVLYCIVLYCIVLYCIVLYCIVLYCIVLYCIVLFCIVLYCIVLYCIVLYCIVLDCIVLYCIVLYCIVLHCIALYCIVLYCIVLYCIVLYCIVLYCIVATLFYTWLTHVNKRNNISINNKTCKEITKILINVFVELPIYKVLPKAIISTGQWAIMSSIAEIIWSWFGGRQ